MIADDPQLFQVADWTIFTHPLFEQRLHELISEVELLKEKNPIQYEKKPASKKLAALYKLIFEKIPSDPASEAYRQGKTIGSDHKHWCRAKLSQQYRIFFQYRTTPNRQIIYVWINDSATLRARGRKTDVYTVFAKMLKKGNPPNNWEALIQSKAFKVPAN